MTSLIIPSRRLDEKASRACAFWDAFTSSASRPRIVFGRNVYAESVIQATRVDAVIDDFCSESEFAGCPVVRTVDVPKDAIVLAASGGRPLSVRRALHKLNLENLDYFAVRQWAAPELRDVVFNEGFAADYAENEREYRWAFDRLADSISRDTFRKLLSFRLTYDLDLLEGFEERQKEQYFEDFLALKVEGEVFVDIGCYDGYTSLEFAKRCPEYRHIYAFEPDPNNFQVCSRTFSDLANITLFPFGADESKTTHRFEIGGSASAISDAGKIEIKVDRADDVLSIPPTFVKIDTEGSEAAALKGAQRLISSHAPRLAISIYHKPGDFWRIPKLVLGMQDRYKIFIRHYTESIYETVMFFLPRG